MTDLTPETIAHLRELDAARTQGEWRSEPIGSEGFHVFGPEGSRAPLRGRARVAACTWRDWDEADADAEFIAMAANHMGALLDAAEERDKWKAVASAVSSDYSEAESRVDRIASERDVARAELAEARATIERVAALRDEWVRLDAGKPGVMGWYPSEFNEPLRQLTAALAPAAQHEEGE